jgi:serine/threonine protein kinase
MGCGGSKTSEPAKVVEPSKASSGNAKNSASSDMNKSLTSSKGDGDGEYKTILGRFKMMTTKAGVMGEGSFCICRKGVDTQTGREVAIKAYKVNPDKPKEKQVCLKKFRRQIEVLKDLGVALDKNKVAEAGLWSTSLENVKVGDVFIQLIEYSKDNTGQPGNDPTDGVSYVITELADHSMKDFLAQCREEQRTLERPKVQSMTRSIITVIAALHAKGLVHLDIKPENLMRVGGLWKLIDVDGCVKIGSKVSIRDASISFSPCYCAPEWARFLIEDQETIKITSGLDVWSVGITVAELVSLDAILKAKYVSYLKQGCSHREAGFFFMDWLSNTEVLPLPPKVESYDAKFLKLLRERLLVSDATHRSNLSACIDDPFFEGLDALGMEAMKSVSVANSTSAVAVKKRARMRAHADDSGPPGICHSTLWKLNTEGDVKNIEQWLKRDMWVAKNGNLCYFSMKENKRLVYMDRSRLMNAKIRALTETDQAARNCAFQIQVSDERGEFESVYFAAEDDECQKKWIDTLINVATTLEWDEPQTVVATTNFVQELRQFKLTVRNRRASMAGQVDPFLPCFKAMLWKLKQDGDVKQADHWFQREMWVSKNGSLCYYSKKQEKNLIYYNHGDLEACTLRELPAGSCALEHAFEVKLKAVDGCDFEPGVFATDTPELRETWMKELAKLSVKANDDKPAPNAAPAS